MSTSDYSADLLNAALQVVTGPRRQEYGDPEHDLECSGQLMSAWLNRRFGVTIAITGADVSQLMILHKAARLAHTPGHHDSWLDQAGYAACGWRCTAVRADQSASSPMTTGTGTVLLTPP